MLIGLGDVDEHAGEELDRVEELRFSVFRAQEARREIIRLRILIVAAERSEPCPKSPVVRHAPAEPVRERGRCDLLALEDDYPIVAVKRLREPAEAAREETRGRRAQEGAPAACRPAGPAGPELWRPRREGDPPAHPAEPVGPRKSHGVEPRDRQPRGIRPETARGHRLQPDWARAVEAARPTPAAAAPVRRRNSDRLYLFMLISPGAFLYHARIVDCAGTSRPQAGERPRARMPRWRGRLPLSEGEDHRARSTSRRR